MTTRQNIFKNIGESFRRSPSKFSRQSRVADNDEARIRNRSGSQLDEAEQQRIMIGNLVKVL
ncbi:Hypothetical predicted protein [Paramuricea clavata]|uniref:Uncharacterized protein n=1 Tax=Paramuricea clavata TaxID=317549 RepID=A0A6S7JVK8_PARCT|nr:Hypothetical predicted protein [Paramuricea clavata]